MFSFKQPLPKESYIYGEASETFFVFASEEKTKDDKLTYIHFLKYYQEIDATDSLFQDIFLTLKDSEHFDVTKVQVPKYIVFFSHNPFFLTFKSIMKEIVHIGRLGERKGVNLDKVLEYLFYRIPLPSHNDTQVCFTFGRKIYNLNSSPFPCDVSLKMLFHFFSPSDISLLMLSFLSDSIIIFVHSKFLLNKAGNISAAHSVTHQSLLSLLGQLLFHHQPVLQDVGHNKKDLLVCRHRHRQDCGLRFGRVKQRSR